MNRKIDYLFTLLFFLLSAVTQLSADNGKIISGTVRDSISGQPLDYVTISFPKTTIGTITDKYGFFQLKNENNITELSVSMVGYRTKRIPLRLEKRNKKLDILLAPTAIDISEIVVKPKRRKYRRKENPAVALIRNVIKHKEANSLSKQKDYKVEAYEKLSFSLEESKKDLNKHVLVKSFKQLAPYINDKGYNGKQTLTLSLRENISDIYHLSSGKEKTIVRSKRTQGIDAAYDQLGLVSANLDEIFSSIDIFENDIFFLLNKFVSPTSSLLANSYYEYYITDSLQIADEKYIELSFVPVNSRSYGFTGNLLILMDGTYAVKKASLKVPYKINLNYVKSIAIEQEFGRIQGNLWGLQKEDKHIVFHVPEFDERVYTHQSRTLGNYDFSLSKNDSVFDRIGKVFDESQQTAVNENYWDSIRHVPLASNELAIETLMKDLNKSSKYRFLSKTIEILSTKYIAIDRDSKKNKIDIGPVNNMISGNKIEGLRLRVGGVSTANLHPQLFFNGYAAYAFFDKRWKYNTELTYSFNKKVYHEKEAPINTLSIGYNYDLYTPGENFLHSSKDNVFSSVKTGKITTLMNYIRRYQIRYEKEWLNGFSFNSWLMNIEREAAGDLAYRQINASGDSTTINNITTSEWGLQFRYAPGERAFNSRKGKTSNANLSRNAPVFYLSHKIGIKDFLKGEYNFHHSEASIKKRIWLSSFGHIDTEINAGKIWNKVPFPLLFFPNTNQSIIIKPSSFQLMNPMEFVADQYIAFEATYRMKGWLLNRIPLINSLQLREVLSIHGVYGNLTQKNNPKLTDHLFLLPNSTQMFGKEPYLEFSVGIENIFRIFQINYYRRINYLNHPDISKNGIRLNAQFTF